MRRRPAQESVLGAGAISLVGSGIAAGTALVLAVVVARAYGAAGTGVFFEVVGWFTLLAGVLKLGTNSGVVRAISRSRALGHDLPETRLIWYAVWPVTLAALLCAGLVWVDAPRLATRIAPDAHVAELTLALRALAPCLVVAAVLSTLHTAVRMMRGVLAFTVLQNILVPSGRVAAVLLAAWAGWTVVGALVAWAALLPVWLLVTACALWGPVLQDLRRRSVVGRTDADPGRSEARSWREGRGETLGGFWRFTGGRALGSAVEVGLDWADVLVVAALRPAHEAGIYAVVTRAARAGQVGDRALRIAVSPRIAELLALDEHDRAAQLHTVATKGLVLLVWPFYLALVTMGPAVLALFGPDFADGALPMAVLAGASMLAALAGMLQSILLMAGRSSWQVYTKGTVLAVSVLLNLALVPHLGLMGAATTFLVVVLVDTVVTGYLVHRGIGVDLRPAAVVRATLLPLACFGLSGVAARLLGGTGPATLVTYLLVAGGAYLALLWLLRDRLGLTQLASPTLTQREKVSSHPGAAG